MERRITRNTRLAALGIVAALLTTIAATALIAPASAAPRPRPLAVSYEDGFLSAMCRWSEGGAPALSRDTKRGRLSAVMTDKTSKSSQFDSLGYVNLTCTLFDGNGLEGAVATASFRWDRCTSEEDPNCGGPPTKHFQELETVPAGTLGSGYRLCMSGEYLHQFADENGEDDEHLHSVPTLCSGRISPPT